MSQLGRISGPLLKDNLTRDGVNLAFETNLLFLKVDDRDGTGNLIPANFKIGIKTDNPGYSLDIAGVTRVRETFLVKPAAGGPNASAEIDDIKLDARTISTLVGSLEIQAATGSDRVNINSNTRIDGDLEVVGNITLGGTINIGDSNTDDVIFGGEVKSNIIPDATGTYDLGSALKTWRTAYLDNILVGGLSVGNVEVSGSFVNDQIDINGNQIRTFRSNADLELDTAGTGQVVVLGQGGMIVPVGTTAERPDPARTGTIRLNTDTQRLENYNGVAWNRMLHDDDAIAFAIALG
jgi:hypothetical protein